MKVVVIGAGFNGLVCAAVLAKAKHQVTVLEARDVVGGLAAGEEFHPGYRHVGVLHDESLIRPRLAESLGLFSHGCRPREVAPSVLAGEPGRGGVWIHPDAGRTASLLRESALADADADAFVAYAEFLGRVGPFLAKLGDREAPDITDDRTSFWELLRTAVSLRLLGRKDMLELLRAAPMPVADWLGERFQTPCLGAALALPTLVGSYCGPRAPGTTTNFLLHRSREGRGVVGGPAALVAAVEKACQGGGVSIRTGSAVERILIERGRVTGVLVGGESVGADAVVSGLDPRSTVVGLCHPSTILPSLFHEASVYRLRGAVAKVHLALDGPLEIAGREGEAVEVLTCAASMDDIERASDPLKYGQMPETPVLDVRVPTVSEPSLAPSGHHVVSIIAQFVPYHLEGGWGDAERDALAERVVRTLAAYAPKVVERIVGRETLTPADIEARYGASGGHVHHGETALDQLLIRPFASCMGHRTPVRGLYLCGPGTHPGGGVSGAPGALAAQAVCADA